MPSSEKKLTKKSSNKSDFENDDDDLSKIIDEIQSSTFHNKQNNINNNSSLDATKKSKKKKNTKNNEEKKELGSSPASNIDNKIDKRKEKKKRSKSNSFALLTEKETKKPSEINFSSLNFESEATPSWMGVQALGTPSKRPYQLSDDEEEEGGYQNKRLDVDPNEKFSVYIKEIPLQATYEEIKSHFQPCLNKKNTESMDIRMVKDRNNNYAFKGIAFIDFPSESSMKKALDMHKKKWSKQYDHQSKVISVMPTVSKDKLNLIATKKSKEVEYVDNMYNGLLKCGKIGEDEKLDSKAVNRMRRVTATTAKVALNEYVKADKSKVKNNSVFFMSLINKRERIDDENKNQKTDKKKGKKNKNGQKSEPDKNSNKKSSKKKNNNKNKTRNNTKKT